MIIRRLKYVKTLALRILLRLVHLNVYLFENLQFSYVCVFVYVLETYF